MNEPVRILSDLHLGHKISRITRVSALRPLISGAATVVFNGDTWQELAAPFRAKAGFAGITGADPAHALGTDIAA